MRVYPEYNAFKIVEKRIEDLIRDGKSGENATLKHTYDHFYSIDGLQLALEIVRDEMERVKPEKDAGLVP